MAGRRNPRAALVTGGGGFIGSHLVRGLRARGWRVTVLDVEPGDLVRERDPGLSVVGGGSHHLRGGMADRRLVARAVRGAEVVYHLALNWNGATWRQHVPLADRFDVNVRGTLNLLEAARRASVRHFLFASSLTIYGGGAGRLAETAACWPEEWDGTPGSGYAILKLMTEKLCLMYGRLHDLPVTALRLDYVLGEDESPADGGVAVEDVVEGFLGATLNRAAFGQVLNLAGPRTGITARKARRVLGWTPRRTRARLKGQR